MNKILRAIFITIVTVFLTSSIAAQTITRKVLISQTVEHPALSATISGIIAGLKQNGYQSGVNLEIRIESAQASSVLAAQIATKFVNQNPDIVVGVGTISAQSFIKYARKNQTKLIFSSVTDPLQAGLIKELDKPGNNTSGVSNFVKLEPQIKLFKQIQPSLKNLGILYNPGELNSISIVNNLEKISPEFNIKLVKQTANKTAEVAQAATKLASNVDAIFISNDNTALSALQSIILAANKARIPVYVSDTDAVKLGALAALGPNQYQIGLQTGKMIARVLNGESIANMPVEFPKQNDLCINEKIQNLPGVSIPQNIKKQAAIL